MAVSILPYKFLPPGPVLFVEMNDKQVQSAIAREQEVKYINLATHPVDFMYDPKSPHITYEKRLDFLGSGLSAFMHDDEVDKPIPEDPQHYVLDMHRWIGKVAESEYKSQAEELNLHDLLQGISPSMDKAAAVSKRLLNEPPQFQDERWPTQIREFVKLHGDFFNYDVGAPDFRDYTVLRWLEFWRMTGRAAAVVESVVIPAKEGNKDLDLDGEMIASLVEPMGDNAVSFLDSMLQIFTGSSVKPQRQGARQNLHSAIRPNSWAGWCWALIARDLADKVTYTPCSNHRSDENLNGCDHEVPSSNPFGRTGRPMKHCSTRCRKATERRS